MNSTASAVVITACCFFAAILNLAVKTRLRGRFMGAASAIAAVAGIFVYGYAYAQDSGLSVVTVCKALLTVCRMFVGVNDYAAVAATPLFRSGTAIALFWVMHFLAFYAFASAAIETLGKRLLKRIRLWLLRRGPLTLAYGATPENVSLVTPRTGSRALVFVADGEDAAVSGAADAMNGVLFAGGAALLDGGDFLRGIGVGGNGRELDVYCLDDDAAKNLRFAEALARAMERRSVDSRRSSLFLLGVPEAKVAHLQAAEGRYGFGSVFAGESYELVARLAVHSLPPWTLLKYDGKARATGDLRVFIVGFGRMGRAMLRQLVMNGQMEGSAFRATVFDRRMEDLSGYVEACFPELLRAYDISLRAGDACSGEFYRLLAEQKPDLIALCGGSRKQNGELALDLERYYAASGRGPRVLQCTVDGVIVDGEEHRLGSVDVREMDRRAMRVNHAYTGGPSPEEDWRACPPFSRASSRASADFAPAFLYAAEAAGVPWPPEGEALENLARTEHLRWCAFHLAMGYRPMSEEEFERRAEALRRGEKLRLGKDDARMLHACLVPWEALDALSRRENAVRGGSVDYKQMDRNNVLLAGEIGVRSEE